jgi:hypothetical protein
MGRKKKKDTGWILPAIIVGVCLFMFIFLRVDITDFNMNTEEYIYKENSAYQTNTVTNTKQTNTETYCFNGECYTTRTEYNNAVNDYEQELAYDEASEDWEDHRSILNNDGEKTDEALDSYCENIDMTGVPDCVNIVYPRLEAYATHIVNAQNFLHNEGDVFSNKQKLLANLDEQAIYVKTIANNLDTMVNQYNALASQQQAQQEQAQQEAEALSNIIKILAMAI